jgi:hypothetical protein
MGLVPADAARGLKRDPHYLSYCPKRLSVSIKTKQSCLMAEERSHEVQPVQERRASKVKPLLYLVLAMALLGALYALVKPQSTVDLARPGAAKPAPADSQLATPATPAPVAQPTAPVGVPDAKPDSFDIVVQRGRRVSEPAVLQVHQGDEVTLRITADVADELHLHGYNLRAKLLPDRTTTLQFKAKLTGRFTYELHKSGLELGALEVYPR